MRLTRHARNRQRLYKVQRHEVGLIIRSGRPLAPDQSGNRRIVGSITDGRKFIVVIALDNPDLVITLIERSER